MRGRIGMEKGFVLIELLVSMAIMGLVLSVATVALGPVLDSADEVEASQEQLRQARWKAIDGGRPVVSWPDSAHVERPTLLLPDGRMLGSGSGEGTSKDTLGSVS